LAEEIVCVIAKLLDLTVFANFIDATSLKTFVFCGHCLTWWPKCEQTECDADMSQVYVWWRFRCTGFTHHCVLANYQVA